VTTFQLYFDDSGAREPDHKPSKERVDKIDHFALGGILVNENSVQPFLDQYYAFMKKWELTYPLHSTKIRGRRKEFAWLGKDQERGAAFLTELGSLVCALPYIAFACTVHRPGYNARYKDKHDGKPWMLCKTACAILVERAAKYADSQSGHLEIYFEGAGKHEDRDIIEYVKALKQDGMPFDQTSSQGYGALSAADFRRIVLGEPHRRTKATPMCQIADMVLYPIVKGRYDAAYAPYNALITHKKLIDCYLSEAELAAAGIKYSCFDNM